MRLQIQLFQSGKRAGLLIYWSKYRTYIHREYGWKGSYPKDKPRLLLTGQKWWHGGGLMLIDSRFVWETQRWPI